MRYNVPDELAAEVGDVLRAIIGQYDWDSPHLKNTPKRYANMLHELTDRKEFEFTTFPNNSDNHIDEMIVIKDITFVSLCAHHIIPFTGVAHIAYIPNNTLAGLSKFARAVDYWSKGLWTQEHLTEAVAAFIHNKLDPIGVAVIMEAEHMCMSIRGVQKPGTKTVTSRMNGAFLDPTKGARQEFLDIINRPR